MIDFKGFFVYKFVYLSLFVSTMDYLNFRNTRKQNLSEFNLGEIRGWIIDRMCDIESKIDSIISSYFKPEKSDDFEKIVLNSAILSFGAKTKILVNIKDFDKKIITKIQKISTIRNAFAHLPIREDVNIQVKTINNGVDEKVEIEVNSKMEIMMSSGELKYKNTIQLVEEFSILNNEIREYLINFKIS